MSYRYVASTKDGKIHKGTSDLMSRNAVIEDLESRSLIVISVEESRLIRAALRAGSGFLGPVRHIDRVLLTKHLSVMLRAGLSLLESLRILQEQAASRRLRRVLEVVAKAVEGGGSFADALSEHSAVFSTFFVSIVRAGEISGTLETSLDHLAVQLSKEHELRTRVRSAAFYPAIVLTAAALIGFFFATYVIPQVANLFIGLKGIELPLMTRLLLNSAAFLRNYTFQTFFGGLAGILLIYWFLRRPFVAPVTHLILLRLPILSKVVRDVNLARFSLLLSTLLKSGIPITQALQVTSDVLGNYYFKQALEKALVSVQQGEALSDALERSPHLYPKIVVRMINVGERSGKLEEVLSYLSEFYDLEVQTTMRNLTTIMEPVLLLLIGLVALGLAFAIIIPIYNFIGAISRL
ncbi:MAG: type II secretion system F family protein [Patescibacteria group bacterium]